jgi:hypothetical protein
MKDVEIKVGNRVDGETSSIEEQVVQGKNTDIKPHFYERSPRRFTRAKSER